MYRKAIARRAKARKARVEATLSKHVWRQLGITPEMVQACTLPWQQEPISLVDAGLDILDRPQKMTGDTFHAWQRMKAAAADEGIQLLLVSAYRSVDYQCQLIKRKLDKGQEITKILKANAIPGFSEHHSGCALDLHDGEGTPLTQDFDERAAFNWLEQNAEQFKFALSYPKDNPHGMMYEPWHWRYQS